jgi:hypothetical protein
MKYFPLSSDTFMHQFGVRALEQGESILETTDHYEAEIKAKRSALELDPDYYFAADENSVESQVDAVRLIIEATQILSESHNTRSGETLEIDPTRPLLSISRHVQEDLTILRNDSEAGFPLIAGSVCFPSGWCIGDKIGHSVTAVHAPVPEFETALAEPTYRLMQRLKVGRPVWRTNWGVRSCGRLDQSPRHREALDHETSLVTNENAGERCYFRVERQTLARLPASGNVLFAIHTHQSKLSELEPQERQNLIGVIRSCPEPTLKYKGISPVRNAIETYLQNAPLG